MFAWSPEWKVVTAWSVETAHSSSDISMYFTFSSCTSIASAACETFLSSISLRLQKLFFFPAQAAHASSYTSRGDHEQKLSIGMDDPFVLDELPISVLIRNQYLANTIHGSTAAAMHTTALKTTTKLSTRITEEGRQHTTTGKAAHNLLLKERRTTAKLWPPKKYRGN